MDLSNKNIKVIHVLLLALLFCIVGGTQALAGEDDGGTIVFTKPVKAVIFSHDKHVEDIGLECDSCHDDIFEMETGYAESQDDFTMESLYAGKYCGACHDGDMAFASNTRCTTCHIGVKGYNRMQGGGEKEGDQGGH